MSQTRRQKRKKTIERIEFTPLFLKISQNQKIDNIQLTTKLTSHPENSPEWLKEYNSNRKFLHRITRPKSNLKSFLQIKDGYSVNWQGVLKHICEIIGISKELRVFDNKEIQITLKKYFNEIEEIKPLIELIDDFIRGVAKTHNPYGFLKGADFSKAHSVKGFKLGNLYSDALKNMPEKESEIEIELFKSFCYEWVFKQTENDNTFIAEMLIDDL